MLWTRIRSDREPDRGGNGGVSIVHLPGQNPQLSVPVYAAFRPHCVQNLALGRRPPPHGAQVVLVSSLNTMVALPLVMISLS